MLYVENDQAHFGTLLVGGLATSNNTTNYMQPRLFVGGVSPETILG